MKKLVIIAIFSNDKLMDQLVLKGGNLLDLVHGISTRPSKDVDLSMRGQFDDPEEARKTIEQALTQTFAEHGCVVFDVNLVEAPPRVRPEIQDFWGGYQVDFKIIPKERFDELGGDLQGIRKYALPLVQGVGLKGPSPKFPIDISKFEYCDEKEEFLLDGYTIYGYSPRMMVCEKLRTICQQMEEYCELVRRSPRPRARDFLDIHTMAEYFGVDFSDPGFHQTLRKVFAVKRVDLKLLSRIGEEAVRERHRADFDMVRETVKPGQEVQSYDFYFDYVAVKVQELEALWNE
jgi:hypothetical protein